MKLNENTIIFGTRVCLVPYEKHHVPKYHDWMKSEELQTLTASEPLSLEEEYEMVKRWRLDPDKCTFIILDKEKYEATQDEVHSMIGDTNIFLKISDESEKEIAEIEIMIAELNSRGKGNGKEAVLLMLRYGIENLQVKTFQAKISMSNSKSITLFESLGFLKTCESPIFQEVTLQKKVSETWLKWIKEKTNDYCLKNN